MNIVYIFKKKVVDKRLKAHYLRLHVGLLLKPNLKKP